MLMIGILWQFYNLFHISIVIEFELNLRLNDVYKSTRFKLFTYNIALITYFELKSL